MTRSALLRCFLVSGGLLVLGQQSSFAQSPMWTSKTYASTNALFSGSGAAALSVTDTISLPASTAICGLSVNVTTPFTSMTITAFTIQVGSSVADPSVMAFSLPFSLMPTLPAVSLTDQLKVVTAGSYNLLVQFTANMSIGFTGGTYLMAGNVKVSYCTIGI
jgi:hypothetical protein